MKRYWIYDLENNLANVASFVEGTEPLNTLPYNGELFIKAIHSNGQIIEGATLEEIAEVAYQIEIESAKSFMEQKENDGCSFYKEIDLKMTIALSKIEIAVLFEILNEVDNVLYPPLMKIKTGDFASALFIFSNQQAPTNDFVLDFYTEAISYCQYYYNTKYPNKK